MGSANGPNAADRLAGTAAFKDLVNNAYANDGRIDDTERAAIQAEFDRVGTTMFGGVKQSSLCDWLRLSGHGDLAQELTSTVGTPGGRSSQWSQIE